MDDSVELIGGAGMKVVTPAFGAGTVDDADGSLQPGLAELTRGGVGGVHTHHELADIGCDDRGDDHCSDCPTHDGSFSDGIRGRRSGRPSYLSLPWIGRFGRCGPGGPRQVACF